MDGAVRKEVLLREADVMQILRLKSRSAIWRHDQCGILPQPIRIGGAARWISKEVDQVVEPAVSARRDAEPSE